MLPKPKKIYDATSLDVADPFLAAPGPIRIGKYLLLERIGMGGMAEVFLGKSLGEAGFEKLLAVKRVLPPYAQDPDCSQLFEFEAKLSSQLSHPNIVHIYDFIRAFGSLLLIMEFVPGKNLAQLMDKVAEQGKRLPTEWSVYIISEVLKALDYAHSRRNETIVL